jgi:hypothetical protein
VEDVNNNGTVDPDEKNCSQYSPIPVTSTVCASVSRTRTPKSARPARPDANCPFVRGHLSGAVGLVVDGTTLVLEHALHPQDARLRARTDTGFPPVTTPPTTTRRIEGQEKERVAASGTAPTTIRYIGLTLNKPATPRIRS